MSITSALAEPNPAQKLSSNPYNLSARELEIASGLRQGLSELEIAEARAIPLPEMQRSLDRIMGKLGARNTAHLGHIMASMGELDVDWVEIVYLDELDDDLGESPTGSDLGHTVFAR